MTKKTGSAHIALSKIQAIYKLDKELCMEYPDEEDFCRQRKQNIKPLLQDFEKWLLDKSGKVRPDSVLGKAIKYAVNQWENVSRFIESPYLTPDNNAAERAIRPFVIGRKNWLFSGCPWGARA